MNTSIGCRLTEENQSRKLKLSQSKLLIIVVIMKEVRADNNQQAVRNKEKEH